MHSFHDSPVWEKAHELALDVYRATERFPAEERTGLANHMRWVAVSIPAHIAHSRSTPDAACASQSLRAAERALHHLSYYLELSQELGYLLSEHFALLSENVERIDRALHRIEPSLSREPVHAFSPLG